MPWIIWRCAPSTLCNVMPMMPYPFRPQRRLHRRTTDLRLQGNPLSLNRSIAVIKETKLVCALGVNFLCVNVMISQCTSRHD
jgi:hypothetical protein